MQADFYSEVERTLGEIKAEGFFKTERVLKSAQGPAIRLDDGREVVNFCANNYLGLANDPRLIEAAIEGLRTHGFGMASVRFICGTQDIHRELETQLARFLKMDDAILYSSCFDANTGLFETILGEADAIISDALNHASIIDGVRLCKAKRYRYANNDMEDLEAQLKAADKEGARFKLIATDGVFSMDGLVANLTGIRELADRYGALVMVDDSHAVGFIGAEGGGTPELAGLAGKIDILTGTLGKAMGGASGGFVAARRSVIDLLRQRSRPYLFSNSLAPSIVAASLAVLKLLATPEGADRRRRVMANAGQFRSLMTAHGFALKGAGHPIIPVMLGEAAHATRMADALLAEGIYVVGFSYPVVPKGQARVRTQMCATHTPAQIKHAAEAFGAVGRKLGIL
jgi:glycine C-acetyltransferase